MRTATYSIVVVIVVLFLGNCLTCQDAFADAIPYDLIIELDTLYVAEGATHVQLPVTLTSPLDSIAGFSILMQVDRPGVCSLRTTPVTTGCLTESWPTVVGLDLGGTGYAVKYVGLSSLFPDSVANAIPPQATAAPLFIVELDIFGTVPAFEDGARLLITTTPVDVFNFSDPRGHSLGVVGQPVEVSDCYRCNFWLPSGTDSVCADWQLVATPPCDSVFSYVDTVAVVDTGLVHVGEGWIDVVDWVCGDFDNNQTLNLTDLTLMVNYIFLGGSPPVFEGVIDLYEPCTSGINLTDLTLLVNHLFVDSQPLNCCFEAP